jgi:hypothetical protein
MANENVTVDNADEALHPLTAGTAEKVFMAYHSPLTGQGATLVEVFNAVGVSGWIGLAVIKRESSFANKDNNPSLDNRNQANPFGAHFNETFKPPCAKNKLLISDSGGKFVSPEHPECNVTGYRLPTFRESAQHSAGILRRRGVAGYNPRGEQYKMEINSHLRDIVRRLGK